LEETVRTHFANEEEVLSRHHCPNLGKHHAAHIALLAELTAIAASCAEQGETVTEETLTQFVRKLVLDHVLTLDMDAKIYLEE
ncbi:MAG: hypothetical protein K2X44_01495, partial [Magnetospirillum sp.]|nr:hypothetical protein [Magnetospirillum sp.]